MSGLQTMRVLMCSVVTLGNLREIKSKRQTGKWSDEMKSSVCGDNKKFSKLSDNTAQTLASHSAVNVQKQTKLWFSKNGSIDQSAVWVLISHPPHFKFEWCFWRMSDLQSTNEGWGWGWAGYGLFFDSCHLNPTVVCGQTVCIVLAKFIHVVRCTSFKVLAHSFWLGDTF